MLFPMLAGSLFTEYRIKRISSSQAREKQRGVA